MNSGKKVIALSVTLIAIAVVMLLKLRAQNSGGFTIHWKQVTTSDDLPAARDSSGVGYGFLARRADGVVSEGHVQYVNGGEVMNRVVADPRTSTVVRLSSTSNTKSTEQLRVVATNRQFLDHWIKKNSAKPVPPVRIGGFVLEGWQAQISGIDPPYVHIITQYSSAQFDWVSVKIVQEVRDPQGKIVMTSVKDPILILTGPPDEKYFAYDTSLPEVRPSVQYNEMVDKTYPDFAKAKPECFAQEMRNLDARYARTRY